jgi:hypothetical protein
MEKSDAVTFTSSHFQVSANEEQQTNPGVYGLALAQWLRDQLCERGLAVNAVVPEDWGWCIVVKTKPFRASFAVSNVAGSSTRWRVFAFAERGPLQFLRSAGDLKVEVESLREQLVAIVPAVPSLRDVSWEPLS